MTASAEGESPRPAGAQEVCRVLVPGPAVAATTLVLAEPLSLWGGLDPETGLIIDWRHPDRGECVTGRVLVLTRGRGSSSASSVLLEAVRLGKAPAAVVLAEVDGILALGAAVALELYGRTPMVLLAPPLVFANLQSGEDVAISVEGQIEKRCRKQDSSPETPPGSSLESLPEGT